MLSPLSPPPCPTPPSLNLLSTTANPFCPETFWEQRATTATTRAAETSTGFGGRSVGRRTRSTTTSSSILPNVRRRRFCSYSCVCCLFFFFFGLPVLFLALSSCSFSCSCSCSCSCSFSCSCSCSCYCFCSCSCSCSWACWCFFLFLKLICLFCLFSCFPYAFSLEPRFGISAPSSFFSDEPVLLCRHTLVPCIYRYSLQRTV